jgi:hypothetical protein
LGLLTPLSFRLPFPADTDTDTGTDTSYRRPFT